MSTLALVLLAGLTGGEMDLGLEGYCPKAGDIVLFQGRGAIKNFVYALAYSPCATHAGLVVARPDGSLALLEAPGPIYPVMLSDIPSRLRSSRGRIWIRRLRTPLSPEQLKSLTAFACSQEGKPYDTIGVLIPPFGHPIRKWTRKELTIEQMDPPRWFCSSIVVVAAAVCGLIDPCTIRPRFTDPQDLKTDRCLKLLDRWESPEVWQRCSPQTKGWWSRSCTGKVECWE
jgi:hypothetical protein